MNIRWKPMPDHPGYEIDRKGFVRNERGYVVASGRGAQLMVGGVRLGVTRKGLQEIAAVLFRLSAAKPLAKAEMVEEPAPEPPIGTCPNCGLGRSNCIVCGGDGYIKQPSPAVEEFTAQDIPQQDEPVRTVLATDARHHDETDSPTAGLEFARPALRQTCRTCHAYVLRETLVKGQCRSCSRRAAQPAKGKRRTCRTCGLPLPDGYYFNHPRCIHGRSEEGL